MTKDKIMTNNQKLINFLSKIEDKIIKNNSESILLSNQLESSIYGGKNRSCSNIEESCSKSKNKNCTNYNKSGCNHSTNKKSCTNSEAK